MRPVKILAALGMAAMLGGCSRGAVPEGDAWRSEVITAIESTPGVTRTTVSVNDVDPGLGSKGPVIHGGVVTEGDPQPVCDEVLRRVSEVLGQDSSGVGVRLAFGREGSQVQPMRELGYRGVKHGEDLWEATH